MFATRNNPLKHMLKFLVGLMATASLVSCGNVVEEITLNEDNSGHYTMYSDMIPGTVNMALTMSRMFAEKDASGQINEDSLRAAVTEKVWEDFGDQEFDSIIDVLSQMPDSAIKSPEHRAFLERITAFMRGSKAKGYINVGLEYSFADGADYQKMINTFSEIQANQNDQNAGSPLDQLTNMKSKVSVEATQKHFVRKTSYENLPENFEDLKATMAMFGEGKLITIVNTKRKIKSVNGSHIKSIEDYRVTFEYGFIEASAGQLDTNFEIIFE